MIVPLAVKKMLEINENFDIKMSAFEIYNDQFLSLKNGIRLAET